jgi:TRAP-type transport system small permease protein
MASASPASRLLLAARWGDASLGLLSKAGAYVASAAILYILVAIVGEVAHRTIAGSSLAGVLETSEVALVFAAWMGAGFAQRTNAFVATGIVVDRLPRRAAAVCETIALIATAGFAAWVAWYTGERAVEAVEHNESRTGLIDIAVWPARVALAVAFLLLLLETLRLLIIHLATGFRADDGVPEDVDRTSGPEVL